MTEEQLDISIKLVNAESRIKQLESENAALKELARKADATIKGIVQSVEDTRAMLRGEG